MVKKIIASFVAVLFAFSILFVSIFRTASVKYVFTGDTTTNEATTGADTIEYYFAYPGKVLPDSILWPVKAMRDKAWFWMTTDKGRKADLLLLFADKRIAASKILFEQGKADIAFAALEKSQMYLLEASTQEMSNRKASFDTNAFNNRLIKASLKHFEVMEYFVSIAPEDAKPKIIELQNVPKKVYEISRNALLSKGVTPSDNPFNW